MTVGFLGGKLCVEKMHCSPRSAPLSRCCWGVITAQPRRSEAASGVGSHRWAPGAHPVVGRTGYLLRLMVGPGAARQAQQLC